MSGLDVVVIGAGPYGLSAAAYLKEIKGLDVRIFGRANVILGAEYARRNVAEVTLRSVPPVRSGTSLAVIRKTERRCWTRWRF